MIRNKRRIIPVLLGLACYGLFLLWHDLPQAPLSEAEIDAGLAEARAALRAHNRPAMPALQTQMRALLTGDDGKSFIMVNLMRYRGTAQYPQETGLSGTARDAEARYNRMVLPELIKRGSYPVFAGEVTGSFIREEADTEWHQVALVRYRSRRDLLNMAIALAKADADIHKWAALEKTQVFPTRAIVSLNFLRFMVALVLAICACFFSFVARKKN